MIYYSNDCDEVLNEEHINVGIRYTEGGRAIHKLEDEIIKNAELKLKEKNRATINQPLMLDEARKYFNTHGII